MNKIAVLFGGAGYIGSFTLKGLLDNKVFDEYYVIDIKKPQILHEFHGENNVKFVFGDVREPILLKLENVDPKNSWIFNFAAIHREPGHEYKEYFNTNIPGAENVCNFARESGIQNILFTSSIAPYGKSLQQRSEASALYPETAYGISKALAEKIHGTWLAEDGGRRLIVVRPSVIFGPYDPGNVYRMIKSLKKGIFVLPDGGKVIKGYGYVYGLVDSMLFAMQKSDRYILYNYAENPLVPLHEMVKLTKKELGYTKPTLKIPVAFLVGIAFFVQFTHKILGRSTDIHPVRVRKAGFPTNIKPDYLIKNNFNFKYPYQKALAHWKTIAPEDFEL